MPHVTGGPNGEGADEKYIRLTGAKGVLLLRVAKKAQRRVYAQSI